MYLSAILSHQKVTVCSLNRRYNKEIPQYQVVVGAMAVDTSNKYSDFESCSSVKWSGGFFRKS